MKLQLEIMFSVIKKSWFWFSILFILSAIAIILFNFNVNSSVPYDVEYLSIIGVPGLKNYDFKVLLIAIYQMFLCVYVIYTFYTYELEKSFDSVVLRADQRKWISNKVVICLLSVIVFRMIYQLLIYCFFIGEVSFSLECFINPILYHLLLSVLVITLLNFFNKISIISYPLSFMVMFLIFSYFNFIVVILLVVILTIINMLLFRFKSYYR